MSIQNKHLLPEVIRKAELQYDAQETTEETTS